MGLEGSIPSSIGSLSNLEWLYLQENALTGSIPTSLGDLSMLRGLYLSKNKLDGVIPATLRYLKYLKYLRFDNNQLSGPIPASFGSLSSLEDLFIGHNQLTGAIPLSLGDLSSLKLLSLQDNLISGEIPASLGSISSLQTLRLDNNRLAGLIPASIGKLNLLGLYLQNNSLEGQLPDFPNNIPVCNLSDNIGLCATFDSNCSENVSPCIADEEFSTTFKETTTMVESTRAMNIVTTFAFAIASSKVDQAVSVVIAEPKPTEEVIQITTKSTSRITTEEFNELRPTIEGARITSLESTTTDQEAQTTIESSKPTQVQTVLFQTSTQSPLTTTVLLIPTFEPDLPTVQVLDCFEGIEEACLTSESGSEVYTCSGNDESDSAFMKALRDISGGKIKDISVTVGDLRVALLSDGAITSNAASSVEFTSTCRNFTQVSWSKEITLSPSSDSDTQLKKRAVVDSTGSATINVKPSRIVLVVLQVVDGVPEKASIFDQNGPTTITEMPADLMEKLNIPLEIYVSTPDEIEKEFFIVEKEIPGPIEIAQPITSTEKLNSTVYATASEFQYLPKSIGLSVTYAIKALFILLASAAGVRAFKVHRQQRYKSTQSKVNIVFFALFVWWGIGNLAILVLSAISVDASLVKLVQTTTFSIAFTSFAFIFHYRYTFPFITIFIDSEEYQRRSILTLDSLITVFLQHSASLA
jgi:hypothetical protein